MNNYWEINCNVKKVVAVRERVKCLSVKSQTCTKIRSVRENVGKLPEKRILTWATKKKGKQILEKTS